MFSKLGPFINNNVVLFSVLFIKNRNYGILSGNFNNDYSSHVECCSLLIWNGTNE